MHLVNPSIRGNPMSILRWTCKNKYRLTEQLIRQCHVARQRTVCASLGEAGFSLQSTRTTREGKQNEDRDAQFAYIARLVAEYQEVGDPVISVDTQKNE